jgi:predicted lipoprotein with Yx(FWY)xxD motif
LIKIDNLLEEKMKFKKTGLWLALNLIVMFSFILTACSSPAAAPQPTAAPAQPQAAAPNVAPTAVMAPEKTFTLTVAKNPTLGSYLTDQDGRTVYAFTKDTTSTSTCNGGCAQAWPPLEGVGAAGSGVDASLIGVGSRQDGSKQVTYKGLLLYYWAGDTKAGDINGQNIQGVWFVISPSGDLIKTVIPTAAASTAATVAPSPVPPTPMAFTLKVANNPILGNILTDQDGRTVYMFTTDVGGVVNCYDTCAKYWPPLVGTGSAGSGVDASLTGTTTRKDGLTQVTYKGLPVYYFLKDTKPGDVNGQGVQGTWFVLSPSGDIIKTALPTAVPTSSTTAKSTPGY